MQKCKIKSLKYIGKKKTYNLTMKSSQHNYAIYDDKIGLSVISANSHAAAYSLISYQTCYLKANYPDEFVCAFLSIEAERALHDKVEEFEKDFTKKLDIIFLPRDINKCMVSYSIEKKKNISSGILKTEMRPTLLCKGVGYNAAKHIQENQPYKNLKELAEKTDSSVVDSRVICAFAENGFFGKNKSAKNIEKIVEQFIRIKKDFKLAAKKGVESVDIFE